MIVDSKALVSSLWIEVVVAPKVDLLLFLIEYAAIPVECCSTGGKKDGTNVAIAGCRVAVMGDEPDISHSDRNDGTSQSEELRHFLGLLI